MTKLKSPDRYFEVKEVKSGTQYHIATIERATPVSGGLAKIITEQYLIPDRVLYVHRGVSKSADYTYKYYAEGKTYNHAYVSKDEEYIYPVEIYIQDELERARKKEDSLNKVDFERNPFR